MAQIRAPKLNPMDRAWAIGQIEAGATQREVALQFGVHHTSIGRLVQKFEATGSVEDLARSGRPRATTVAQDAFVTRTMTQNRFMPGRQYFIFR